MAGTSPILPAHIENTVRSIARLHGEHHRAATGLQRAMERITALIGRPAGAALLVLFVLVWIGGDLWLLLARGAPFDPPPFPWLGGLASLTALYAAILILATRQREDQLAQHREQLTLELAILSEQKTAKIIGLLEEIRRDHPRLHDRADAEAAVMAEPADPRSVLNAIKRSHSAPMPPRGPEADGLAADQPIPWKENT